MSTLLSVVISTLPVSEIPRTTPDLSFGMIRCPAGVTLLVIMIRSPWENSLLANTLRWSMCSAAMVAIGALWMRVSSSWKTISSSSRMLL